MDFVLPVCSLDYGRPSMSQDLNELIELSILRDEVQHLKAYAVRLERENAALMDRLSFRRPTNGIRHRPGWLRKRLAAFIPMDAPRPYR